MNARGDTGEAAGQISADVLYTLPELKQRLGLGDFAMRQARQAGLPVRKIGRRRYVLGSDVVTWLKARKEAESNVAQG